VLLRTLRVCLVVTAITVVLGYVLSYVWVFGPPRQRVIVEFGVLIPFWISTLTRAFGWLALLYNRGIVNTALTDLGLIDSR
jgi:putative spermidine/putrescine transport system permease protein